MERSEQDLERVRISKDVFDGLETIRTSGATNMLDRPTVLILAREWGLTETADWIESVDKGTYGRLILFGPEILDAEEPETGEPSEEPNIHRVIIGLGRRASSVIATSYETEEMNAPIDPDSLVRIDIERRMLNQNLAEVAKLRMQLDESLTDIERGIKTLQDLIDPENY